MAIKTFSVGEVLTASDTNTFLANAGLVYVTSTTVGTAVSTVTINNCFSSTYDNYHFIWSGGTMSAGTRVDLKIGTATANYDMWMVYGDYAAGAVAPQALGLTNQVLAFWVGGGDTNAAVAEAVLIGPNLPKYTYFRNTGFYFAQQGTGFMTGRLKDTTQHTGFTLSLGGGTMTGGTITVYGYRKA